jgi:hypothetical protein
MFKYRPWGRQPPIQWVPGTLTPGVKWTEREADHSPPLSAEVKMACCTEYVFMVWFLIKHRDNFTFTYA